MKTVNTRQQVALNDEFLTRLARKNLRTFVELAWHILEPDTPFVSNWSLDVLCEHLQAVTEGRLKRLVINLPPRYGKSIVVSVFWPVWEWLRRPSTRWLFVSHSDTLATKLSLDRRRVIQSEWFQQRWGAVVRLARDQQAKSDFHNTRRGVMFAASMGGPLTGKGGTRLVIDDPHSPEQAESDTQRRQAIDRFRHSLVTRLDDKQHGAMVLVMHRLHVEDLSGVCLDLGFDHLCLPALAPRDTTYVFPISGRRYVRAAGEPLWPAREDAEQLERVRLMVGSYAFSGQYQQEPVPRTGSYFERTWWSYYEAVPETFDQVVQSWDLAFKDGDGSDYVVGLVAGRIGKQVYLLDRYKAKASFTETRRAIERMVATYPQTTVILIEEAANGPAIIDDLRRSMTGVMGVLPKGGKLARASAAQPVVERGEVFLPRVSLANGDYRADRRWVEDFVDMCTAFPRGPYDDDVDALTQLVVWVQEHTSVPACGILVQPERPFTRRFGMWPLDVDGSFRPRRLSEYIHGIRSDAGRRFGLIGPDFEPEDEDQRYK